MRILLINAFFLGVVFTAACGGEDGSEESSTILHMRNQDISERDLRLGWRAQKLNNLIGWSLLCSELEGLEADEALVLLRNLSSDEATEEDLWEGAVWKPGQEADDDDSLRAAEILLEECKR